jgi:hypothetical protein
MLTRFDVPMNVNVYFRPERPQRRLGRQKVVHELFVVPSYKVTRRLYVHIPGLHQNCNDVIAFQTPVQFHVIRIKILERRN